MEKLAQDENKGSLKIRALSFLEALQAKHTPGSTTFYLRRNAYSDPRFLELDLKKLHYLENEGVLKMSDYLRQGEVDPNVIALELLPKGEDLLKSRVTTTTQTITETFQAPEEPAWKANKRTRDFVRTDRGNMILSMCPEALLSDIRGHMAALRDPKRRHHELTVHRIWLSYELNWRWNDIPESVRLQMEDFRDLPLIARRKKQP